MEKLGINGEQFGVQNGFELTPQKIEIGRDQFTKFAKKELTYSGVRGEIVSLGFAGVNPKGNEYMHFLQIAKGAAELTKSQVINMQTFNNALQILSGTES